MKIDDVLNEGPDKEKKEPALDRFDKFMRTNRITGGGGFLDQFQQKFAQIPVDMGPRKEKNKKVVTKTVKKKVPKKGAKAHQRKNDKISLSEPPAGATFRKDQIVYTYNADLQYWQPDNKDEKRLDKKAGAIMYNKADKGQRYFNESVLKEGGAMPGVGPIHIDEIEPTLRKLEKDLGVPLVNNALGSVGKKQFSGDMDVALKIDAKDIPEFIEKLKQNKNILDMNQTSVIITKIRIENYDANRTYIDPRTGEDKGVPKGRTGFVQLDFMPGDPDWLKTYYHAPHETDSKYKGVYRNIMIASIAANFDRDDNPEKLPDGRPIESKRYMWSGKDGLVRISRTPKPKANGDGYTKANINKIIAGPWKDPDDIARQLKLDSADDIYSFETLLAAIKKNYGQELINRIVKDFATNSQIQELGVPDEINQE